MNKRAASSYVSIYWQYDQRCSFWSPGASVCFSLGPWLICCCKLPQVYWKVATSPKHHHRKRNRPCRLSWLSRSNATTITATLVPIASHQDLTSRHRLPRVVSVEWTAGLSTLVVTWVFFLPHHPHLPAPTRPQSPRHPSSSHVMVASAADPFP